MYRFTQRLRLFIKYLFSGKKLLTSWRVSDIIVYGWEKHWKHCRKRRPTIRKLKTGEVVEVKELGDKHWEQRIFVAQVDGAVRPYLCVRYGYEDAFREGEPFEIVIWSYCRQIHPTASKE